MKNSNKRTLLIFITLIAIVVVLLAGIVYQFVVINSLQKQIADLNSFFYVLTKRCNMF